MRVLAALLALQISPSAIPTPVDLKASFCSGVLHGSPVFSSEDLTSDYKPNAEIQTILDRANARTESDRKRIAAYLLPRIRFLDPDSLLIAQKAGELALAESQRAIEQCKSGSGWNMTCVEQARTRIKDCYPPDFLPF